jgi:DNA-binding response OmpR family regulator
MSARILLVEDEKHLAFALGYNLTEEGYQVDLASSLEQARGLITPTHDLLLLDVMLPDGSGFDFCKELRRSGNLIPIIILTAKGNAEDVVNGLERGADDYVRKPFALAELLGRISATLRRRHWDASPASPGQADRREQPVLQFGRNRINFATGESWVGDSTVELTELELRLMRFFSERDQLVISRQDLLEGVWGISRQTNTRTIDNFIVRLRKLFETDPMHPVHILTVRGVGYRFVQEPAGSRTEPAEMPA